MREGIGQTARVRLGRWARFGALVGMMLTLIVCGTIAADTKSPSKREQLLAQRSKAWDLYYAGKYDEALKAAEQLEKSAAGDKDQRAAQLEAIHILARCYWADGSKASRAEAQRRWKELEKADDYLANAARMKIAKALMLDDPKKPAQTAQAVALLEEIVKKAIPYTSTAEAAVDLARLYIREKRFDDAKKVMDAGEEFLTRQVKLEMPQAEAAPFLKELKDLKAHLKYDATPGLTEFEAAEKLRKAEKFAEAIPLYQKIIKTYPESDYAPRSDLAIGQCLLGQEKLAEAAAHWKKFITPLPAGPWRGQAYVELIDLFLEEVLDLTEAGKYAELARASLPAALADAKAGDSWKAIAYDVQLRVGLVSFCQNKGTIAAEAFEEAKKLAPNKQAAQSLESLIAAAKTAKAIVPDDVKGDGKGKDNDKVALALSIGVIYTVAVRYDDAHAFLDRVCGVPAVASTRPISARPPMNGASPAQLAFGTFMKGAVLQAKGQREPAKEQFLASMKAFDAGTWHDETLYRVATIIQKEAERQNPVAHVAEREWRVARAKACEAALPYWRELVRRYSTEDKDGKLAPKSSRCEEALFNIGVILCEVAAVAPEQKSEQAWKEAEVGLKRFCEAYPKSPWAGDAYVRRIDVGLERTFDLKLADSVADAGMQWIKTWEDAASRPQIPAAEPWRVATTPLDEAAIKSLVADLRLRGIFAAYLCEKFDKAKQLLIAAGPLEPKTERIDAEKMHKVGLFFLQKAILAQKPVWNPDVLAKAKTEEQRAAIKLADLYLKVMRPEKSAGIYERILDHDPVFAPASPSLELYACIQIARSYTYAEKNHQKAIEVLHRLYKPEFAREPQLAEGLVWLGTLVYNFTQDPKKAMPHFEYVLKHFPDDPQAERAMYFRAVVAIATKDKASAESACNEFIAKYPSSTWAKHVKTLLDDQVAKLPKRSTK